ncbi:LOW QUALITY PROTEIN: aryl hydrocarbon receptor repressor [Ornithorhynchus anatinus]|uniref:LOW QUALITY PROTEIN: aryl hydrocarbon receptor repressor n=1 Tax=Ornithorhynchus anatinus TaxID=9258 RepID=UPI0010A7D159|nr:LOW QUALITY PROTEIN: aryl hydrocarbon receptor repressor [Ornithorhynchus anatinus]
MIPPGECMYAGRKRRKPIQKQKPTSGNEKSNPSKRHRDRLNAELDHLASLLPFPPDIIAKLDKLSVLRLSVSYLRVKSFFQAIPEKHWRKPDDPIKGHHLSSESALPEGGLLLESLNGFALVVSAEGMIFYASSTIVDYLGFHQTDVMHQNIYDYIHVDDRQDFCRQLHWAMNPPQLAFGSPLQTETGEDCILSKLLKAQECNSTPTEYSVFLTRCFICRVRCLLDSTSGFLTMQFQGKLKFLFGQKKKTPSGALLPPRLSLFCIVVPILLPSVAEMKMKSVLLRAKHRADAAAPTDPKAKALAGLCESEFHGRTNFQGAKNSGENGISLFKIKSNEDEWLWVQANGQRFYRSGCSDCAVAPQPTANLRAREEGEPLPPSHSTSGMPGRREMPPQPSGSVETLGQMEHLHWATEMGSQDGVRRKLKPNKTEKCLGQEGPFGAWVSLSGVQGIHHSNSISAFRSATHSPPMGPHGYAFPSRIIRPSPGGEQNPLNPRSHHGPSETFQSCSGFQHFAMGGYAAENVKSQNTEAICEPLLPLDMPIKLENDSDSDHGADCFAISQNHGWLGEKRQLTSLPPRMHFKTELDACEHLVPCDNPKHYIYPPFGGQCAVSPQPHHRAISGAGKEMATLYPPNCAYWEPPHSLQDPEYLSQLYPPGSASTRAQRNHLSSRLPGEPRAPGAVQMIKREPLDSPPWVGRGHVSVQGTMPPKATGRLFFQ